MKEPSGTESSFTRSPTYRSLRNITSIVTRKDTDMEVPSVSNISTVATKKGYLWRLSGRRMLSKSDWKRKYFVLSLEHGKLFYYDNEWGQGSRGKKNGERERGCGVIELKYFIDCVEAPLTDHKKATNVFLLLAAERGFFDQGRCYLSAETLLEMKEWVVKIKYVLETLHNHAKYEKEGMSNSQEEDEREMYHSGKENRRGSIMPEPLYASIKEESIHRSNSMSTLPSLYSTREQVLGNGGGDSTGEPKRRGEKAKNWLNRSMETDGPVCGLGAIDHNQTYSYTSSEESLNESFSINFAQKASRSAETSLRRPSNRNSKPEITLPARGIYGDVRKSFGGHDMSFGNPIRHSSPIKSQQHLQGPSNEYLAKMYSDMEKIDHHVETIQSQTETDGGSMTGTITPISGGGLRIQNSSSESPIGLKQMEQMLKQVVCQSEELFRIIRSLENENTATKSDVGNMQKVLVSTSQNTNSLGDRIALFQATVVGLEQQASALMKEISFTHKRVLLSMDEAEKNRREFVDLKEKAETLFLQLQGEASKQNLQSSNNSMMPKSQSSSANLSNISGSQTWSPRTKQHQDGQASMSVIDDKSYQIQESSHFTPNKHQFDPQAVYAQPVKKSERTKKVHSGQITNEESPNQMNVSYNKPTYSDIWKNSPLARRGLQLGGTGASTGETDKGSRNNLNYQASMSNNTSREASSNRPKSYQYEKKDRPDT